MVQFNFVNFSQQNESVLIVLARQAGEDSVLWIHLLATMSALKNKNSEVHVWKPPDLVVGPYEQSYPFQGVYSSDWLTEKTFYMWFRSTGWPVHDKIKWQAVPII